METQTKTCPGCGNNYPATTEFFYKKGCGIRVYCISCSKEKSKKYYHNNPKLKDIAREKGYEKYQLDPEKYKKKARNYWHKHKDKLNAIQNLKRKDPEIQKKIIEYRRILIQQGYFVKRYSLYAQGNEIQLSCVKKLLCCNYRGLKYADLTPEIIEIKRKQIKLKRDVKKQH